MCASIVAACGPFGELGTVALQAQHIGGLQQVGIVLGAVDVMATVAADAVRIHGALDKIIALHAVLVRRTICEMSESLLAQLVFFQLPEVLQIESNSKANGPVIIRAVDRVRERLPLRMALDANIGGLYGIQSSGIDDVRSWMACWT